ncbi:MAG: hypothetical protein PQ975_12315 [Methanobacterium sp.]
MENLEVKKETKRSLSQKDLWKIKEYTHNAFNKIGSDNYRQKIVYNLLNTTKTSNQSEFFSILLRTLNAQKSDENVKELSDKLQEIYPLTSKNFENVAYSIIMGIMAVKSDGGD